MTILQCQLRSYSNIYSNSYYLSNNPASNTWIHTSSLKTQRRLLMSHLTCKTTNFYDCIYGCKNLWLTYKCRMGIVVNAVNFCPCKNIKTTQQLSFIFKCLLKYTYLRSTNSHIKLLCRSCFQGSWSSCRWILFSWGNHEVLILSTESKMLWLKCILHWNRECDGQS